MANDVYVVTQDSDYDVAVLVGDTPLNAENDNVDVEVRFKDGRVFTATFFTLENVVSLFERNKSTGECDKGLYLYCVNMVLVKELTINNITDTVRQLIKRDELKHAFALVVVSEFEEE